MKTIFTLFIGLLVISSSVLAGSKTTSEYFICHFNDSVSEFDLNELKEQGFQVFETDNKNHVVFVKAKSDSMFSNQLKARMSQLIKVDQNGNKIYIVETVTESSPEFLKVFFNFI